MTVLGQFGFAATKNLDPLTRLYTRQRLYKFLMEQEGKVNLDLPATFVIFKLKHLHHYNTQIGYPLGDRILRCFAQTINDFLPDYGRAGRWGGASIGVVIPFVVPTSTVPWCAKIENKLRDTEVPFELPHYLKTIGIHWSLASSPPHQLALLPQQVENQLKEIYWKDNYNVERFFSNHSQEVFNQKVLLLLLQQKSAHLKEHTLASIHYSQMLGELLRLSPEQMENLRVAALWQNIALVQSPLHKLIKPGPIALIDKLELETHPAISAKWAGHLGVSDEIQKIIGTHHENWDGDGYPYGLKQTEIPLEARILKLVHSFTEHLQQLSWRQNLTVTEALVDLHSKSGTSFDPKLLKPFTEIAYGLPLPREIYEKHQAHELSPVLT